MKKRLKIGLALLLFLIAGVLALRFAVTRPPNPETADVDTLIAYALSDSFASADPDRRQAYIEAMHRRMSEMDDQQADQLNGIWERRIAEASNDVMQQFVIAMLAQQASEYLTLSADQRRAWLEDNQDMLMVDTSPDNIEEQTGSEQAQSSSAMGMADLLKGSSGRQRAEIGILLHDLQQMQNR